METGRKEIVVILGSGIVGRSWAMLFASGGHTVRLYDVIPTALSSALSQIQTSLLSLQESNGLKNYKKFSAQQQFSFISTFDKLGEALNGATYVQECTPENVDMKISTFKELDRVLNEIGNDSVLIGSSSSAIPSSQFTQGLKIQTRTLVAHPINPPYFMRLVELVPNPNTDPQVTQRVKNLLSSLGHKPVVLNKEIPGFALNRIQYSVLNASLTLIQEGILSVSDAETVTKEGLAPRYVFLGPLETAQLNANGFSDYCTRYGETVYNVSLTYQTPVPKFDEKISREIDSELQKNFKNEELGERREWRDRNLMLLSQFKTEQNL